MLYVEYRNNFEKFKTIRNLSACCRCLLSSSLCKYWIQRPEDAKWTMIKEDCSYTDVILSIFVIGIYFEEDLSIPTLSRRVSWFMGINHDPATKKTAKTMINLDVNGFRC